MSNKASPEFRYYKNKEGEDGPISYVEKGWGNERWMLNNDNLCMKILTIEFMKSCSMHFHMEKEEIFFIASGSILFDFIDPENGDIKTVTMYVGDTVHIPPGIPHRMTGADEKGCVFVECSTRHKDEDSYRVASGDSQ